MTRERTRGGRSLCTTHDPPRSRALPRSPARTSRRAGVLALAASVALVGLRPGAAPPAARAEVPEPPLVVGDAATDGQVRITPATQTVSGPRVTWLVTNGGDRPLTFQVAIHTVDATTTAVEVGEPADLALATDTLHLGAGEAARVPLRLDPTSTPRALALVARTGDADPATTVVGLALVGGSDTVAPRVVGGDAGSGTITLRLDAEGPALVDLAVRATAWPGLLHAEEVLEGILVPAEGREVDVVLGGPVAGRVTVEVAVGGSEPRRARAVVWWWPRSLWGATALVLLVLAATGTAVRLRRARRDPTDGDVSTG